MRLSVLIELKTINLSDSVGNINKTINRRAWQMSSSKGVLGSNCRLGVGSGEANYRNGVVWRLLRGHGG